MMRKFLLLFLALGFSFGVKAVTITSAFGYFSATYTTGCTPSATTFNVVTTYPGSLTKKIRYESGSSLVTWTGSSINHTFTTANTIDVFVEYYGSSGSYVGYDYVRIEVYGQPGPVTNVYGASAACPNDKVRMEVSQGWNPSPSFTYSWNWGDGSPLEVSTQRDLQHTYALAGVYTITVTTTGGPCGGTYTSTGTINISNSVPLPTSLAYNVYVGTPEICPNQDMYYAYPEEFESEFIQWGDGSTATSGHLHSYAAVGTYYPQITITNGCGFSATFVDTVDVVNGLRWNPSIPLSVYNSSPICPGEEVNFDCWTNNAISFAWYDQANNLINTNNYFRKEFTSTDTVSLKLTNGCGFDTTLYTVVQVVSTIPIDPSDFEPYMPANVCLGDGAIFAGDMFDEPNETFTFEWVFGDGDTSNTFSGSHTYATGGTYNAVVTVTNTCGYDSTASFTINVGSGIAPDPSTLAYFTPNEEGSCPGDSVLFIALYYNEEGSYLIDFGDGTTSSTPETIDVFGVRYFFFTHPYTSLGTFNTSLKYTNACGLSITKTLDINVGSNAPSSGGAFYDEATTICLGEDINFYGFGGSQYVWDFGDGSGTLVTNSSMDAIPHTYQNPGSYFVTVQVTNSCGNTSLRELNVLVPDNRIYITTNTIDAQCGQSDGKAIAVITGGAQPYDVTWSNGSSEILVDGLASGIYVCNVTDNNGCYNFGIATVSDAQAPAIVVNTIQDVTCSGGNDGVIDINVIGSSAPYTYSWSNGSSSEDQAGLVAGPYEIYVTDANGCTSTASISVNEPDPVLVSFITTDASCGGSNGKIIASANGNSGPYTYVWSSGTVGDVLSSVGLGIYEVNVIDSKGCVVTESTTVDENNGFGGPAVLLNSISALDCSGSGSTIDISVFITLGTPTYDWSNGATTQDITVTTEGEYSVIVTDGLGCKAIEVFEIDHADPSSIPICMVSVDSMYAANKVIFEKPVSTEIAYFKIYRESSMAGLYYNVGTVPYDSLSIFTDIVANPQIQSWRYKISTVDDCGAESALSENHKTVHLNQNLGLIPGSVNLIWDDYEGFSFSTYNVLRYTTATGYQTLASLSSLSHSYTDLTAPLSDSSLFYIVTIDLPSPCVSTRIQNNNTMRSNRTKNAILPPSAIGIDEVQNGFGYSHVYPNPTGNTATVEFEVAQPGMYTIHVFDALGNVVNTINCGQVELFCKKEIDMTNYERGVYTLNIQSVNGKITKRLIKL